MKKGVDFVGVSVSYFCHDGAGNYVMQKRGPNCRDEHGRWDCGGGGLEFEDSVLETLHKEILEEYGVEPLEYEFLGFRDAFREHDGVKTRWVVLDYRVLVDREKVKNGEPHKFTDIGWFRLDALPEPMHSQFDTAFAQYKERLV
jgi:8-oxo-dGTP pyrophosphatase MutT (NUDIX family)